MYNETPGKSTVQSRQPLPLADIADLLNKADAGFAGLLELLTNGRGSVSTEGIAALMKPHADALHRASLELNDHP